MLNLMYSLLKDAVYNALGLWHRVNTMDEQKKTLYEQPECILSIGTSTSVHAFSNGSSLTILKEYWVPGSSLKGVTIGLLEGLRPLQDKPSIDDFRSAIQALPYRKATDCPGRSYLQIGNSEIEWIPSDYGGAPEWYDSWQEEPWNEIYSVCISGPVITIGLCHKLFIDTQTILPRILEARASEQIERLNNRLDYLARLKGWADFSTFDQSHGSVYVFTEGYFGLSSLQNIAEHLNINIGRAKLVGKSMKLSKPKEVYFIYYCGHASYESRLAQKLRKGTPAIIAQSDLIEDADKIDLLYLDGCSMGVPERAHEIRHIFECEQTFPKWDGKLSRYKEYWDAECQNYYTRKQNQLAEHVYSNCYWMAKQKGQVNQSPEVENKTSTEKSQPHLCEGFVTFKSGYIEQLCQPLYLYRVKHIHHQTNCKEQRFIKSNGDSPPDAKIYTALQRSEQKIAVESKHHSRTNYPFLFNSPTTMGRNFVN